MKKWMDLYNRLISCNENMKVYGLYRGSAISELEILNFKFTGNTLTATGISSKIDDVQFELEKVKDFIELIESHIEKTKKRYIDVYIKSLDSHIRCTLVKGNRYTWDYMVKDIIINDKAVYLDLTM